MATALDKLIVLDLSRILAGPWCTQLLADLGATVIKIEHPERGDDTRSWGPPFLRDRAGHETKEAAYYLGVNRNKLSVAVDFTKDEGRDIVRAIYDLIGKKIEVLAEQVTNRSITLVSQEPGDLDRLLMLSELNVAYCTLGVMAFAAGIHPLAAYTELCRIVGRLSIFAPERRPPDGRANRGP